MSSVRLPGSCGKSYSTYGIQRMEQSQVPQNENLLALELKKILSGRNKGSNSVETDNKDYEVENIVDFKWHNGAEYCFIKWKNFDDSCNTWEPVSNLQGCKYLYRRFYLERRKKHFEVLKVITDTEKKGRGMKKIYEEALPPIPTDLRTMDEILKEYTSMYPITQKELDDVLASVGPGVQKPPVTKTEFSRLVGEAIFRVITPERLLHLRKLIIKIEIYKRKKIVDFENKRWELELNNITANKPHISVVNSVDLVLPPLSDFTYLNFSELLCEVDLRQSSGCFCRDDCFENRQECCGVANGSEFAYNRSGNLVVPVGTPVYECNDNCNCDDGCQNRVVQDGYQTLEGLSFCIFMTNNRGWGVKTLKSIRRGAFVAMLVGEVILNEEATLRHQSEDLNIGKYLFDLEYYGESRYIIDFTRKGNITRFFNHSCSPNLVLYPNWYNHTKLAFPRIVFYAAVDICADTELTYSYVDVEVFRRRYGQEFKDGNIPEGFQRCECGSTNCVRFIMFPDVP